MTLQPPAKINLTLDIGALRPDGYHELDTVFQAVSLRDELEVELAPGPMPGPDDLVTRALDLLDPSAQWSAKLTKNIPPQAGLAGGSANAAAALIAGSRLLGSRDRHLPALAVELGSDVPFFLLGGAARGQGRGQRLTPLRDLPGCWFCLAKPEHGVPTPEAYRLLDLRKGRVTSTATERLVREWVSIDGPARLAQYLSNDFQSVIEEEYDEVAKVAEALRAAGAIATVLCGSGSAVAGLCAAEAAAREVGEEMTRRGYWNAIVRNLRRDEWP
jgi:4-diphosphocytidyl-2-C-methyl-D-erythritol kinase